MTTNYKEIFAAATVEKIDEFLEDNYALDDMLEFIDNRNENDFVSFYEEYVTQGEDIGYDIGFDAGYDSIEAPNTLINAVESLIGMFVNFTFIIFSLEIFGISILSIVGVLFGIVAIVWILKTIRG